MSGNIPIGGNNRIVKPQTNSNVAGARTVHTRALGSNASSIFPNDWRPAARGANPNDTQTMRTGLYGRMRAGANSYAMGRSFGGMTMNATQQTNGMSDMEKAAFAITMGKMGVELGKGIADIVNAFSTEKSDGAAPKVKDGTTPGSTPGSTANTVKSASASAIGNMQGATDSATLAAAISDAQLAATDLESSIETIGKNLETLKSTYSEAKGKISELTTNVSKAKGNVTSAKSAVAQKEQAVITYKARLDAAEQTLIESNSNYGSAVTAYNNARDARIAQDGVVSKLATGVATLEGQLAATPKNLPDGTSNPAYSNLETQLTAKKNELTQAKNEQTRLAGIENQKMQEKTTALNALDCSKAGVSDAKQQAQAAQAKLTENEEALKTAKENFENQEVALKKAEGELEQQKNIISDYETQQGNLSDKQGELKDLNKEISSQQNRLETLKKAEEKDAKKLADMQRRQGKLADKKDNAWNRMVGNIRQGKIDDLQEKVAGTSTLNISSSTLDALNDAGVMLNDDDATTMLGHTIQAGTDGTFKIDGEVITAGKDNDGKDITAEQNFELKLRNLTKQVDAVKSQFNDSSVGTITVGGKTYEKQLVSYNSDNEPMYGSVMIKGKPVKNIKEFLDILHKDMLPKA